jgi:NADH-quinone oxidoreductase subunit J
MLLDSLLFYAFAAVILISALMTITRRNVVYAAVWLVNALMGVAGIYLLQGAEFLAGVQVIVYIGGIMVLFLFVIMLVPVREEIMQRRFASQKYVAGFCALLLMGEMAYFLSRGVGGFENSSAAEPLPIGDLTQNSEEVAMSLFSKYVLPFELASILLLVAIIGAVVMAKIRTKEEA